MLKHKPFSNILISVLVLAVLTILMLPAGIALADVSRDPTSGTVGSTLNLNSANNSFVANHAVQIVFGSGSVFASAYSTTSNSTGGLSASITVPPVPTNTYNVTVSDGTNSFATTFQVLSGVSINPSSAQVGDQILITGTGFTAGYTITLRYDSTALQSATANAYGSFGPVYFNVPASAYSSHTISATDGINTAVTTLTVQQGIKVTPNSGGVGDTITISGTGFGAYRSATVVFDTITLSSVPTTDANGSFTTSFVVPAITSRSVTVSANDGTVSAYASFSLLAVVRLNPASGVVSTPITATGSAFGASRSVTISLDGSPIASGSTDSAGAFAASFSIPAATGGAHTISATDGIYSASSTFTVSPQMTLNPKTGNVGIQATVNGSGYGGNKPVTIGFDNSSVGTSTTDATGSFVASFAVPSSASGVHAVSATDGTIAANGQFTTTSSATINPKSGPTGTQVTIAGAGFKSGTAVTTRFNNTQVKNTAADANGAFSDKFVVPDLDAGNYSVVATDGTNTATITFSITASMRLDQAAGNVGSPITVTGTGFVGTVTIKYDGASVATTTADVNGAFTATFNAPVSIHGSHTITANDASTTLQRTFTMDSTPPPVPQPLTPVTNSTQSAKPTFTWSGVTDPSGVSYTLQVASDPGFTVILIQKTALTTAQYKVQPSESLKATGKDAPYYWRVQATDQASNQSAFSAANSFTVSVFPAWAMWLLIAVGALIVLLAVLYIGVRLGRRTTD